LWTRSNAQTWTNYQFDVSKWAGMTIRLQFGVYNDGYNGVTAMYVDDTTMQVCP
jgi:bacillopeptidase F (M6 metalloprotease family)